MSSSSEITIVAVMVPKPDKFDEVGQVLSELVKKVQENEPNVLRYQLHKTKKEYVMIEKYKDKATLDAHAKTPYFVAAGPKLAALLAKPTDLKVMRVVTGFDGRIASKI